MKTQALKGMRDLLPAEQALRDYIQGKILETYRASGFERISTPMLEDMENLDKSDGGDNLNLIFKVLKRGDKLTSALDSGDPKQLSDMGLRYDLTLPLSYKLGPERARPYLYAIIFIPVILLVLAGQMGWLKGLSDLPEETALALFSVLPLIPLAGLPVSYLISCRVVEKKEF